MTIAFELGKSLEEVREYSTEEIRYWMAFFKVRSEFIEKAEAQRARKLKAPKVNINRRG